MSWFKKKTRVVTHDGTFHADDVFAVAALMILFDKTHRKLELVRSRDPNIIASGQIVLDVGSVYDAETSRFDHHQRGGAGNHENGVPYASFGLIWKHFGSQICDDSKIAKIVENNLVVPIDAHDNGVDISIPNSGEVNEHNTSLAIYNFNPTWIETESNAAHQFNQAILFAKQIIMREIAVARALLLGVEETEKQIKLQNEPEILILDKYFDWEHAVILYKNIKLVIYPDRQGIEWSLQVVRDNLLSFDSNRVSLPGSWWGLRDKELQGVTGVDDAIFCARGGWSAKTLSKNGALGLAKKALQE